MNDLTEDQKQKIRATTIRVAASLSDRGDEVPYWENAKDMYIFIKAVKPLIAELASEDHPDDRVKAFRSKFAARMVNQAAQLMERCERPTLTSLNVVPEEIIK